MLWMTGCVSLCPYELGSRGGIGHGAGDAQGVRYNDVDRGHPDCSVARERRCSARCIVLPTSIGSLAMMVSPREEVEYCCYIV
jgi:hypothetical protein